MSPCKAFQISGVGVLQVSWQAWCTTECCSNSPLTPAFEFNRLNYLEITPG